MSKSAEDILKTAILLERRGKAFYATAARQTESEAAAISAAIDFENRAIKVYQGRADETTDPNEKAMYQMLADWERTHHHLLHKLNEDLKEQVWHDNNFWPF